MSSKNEETFAGVTDPQKGISVEDKLPLRQCPDCSGQFYSDKHVKCFMHRGVE